MLPFPRANSISEERLDLVLSLRNQGLGRRLIVVQTDLTKGQVDSVLKILISSGKVKPLKTSEGVSLLRSPIKIWQGYGLAGDRLDNFIIQACNRIDDVWLEVTGEFGGESPIDIYRQVAGRMDSFSRSVLERARGMLISGDEKSVGVGRKILFHNLLRPAVFGLERAEKGLQPDSMLTESCLSFALHKICELLNGYQNGRSTVRFETAGNTINTEVFSYASARKRNITPNDGSDGVGFDELLFQRDRINALRTALFGLGTKEVEMLLLHRLDNLTLEEIGQEYDGLTKERVRQITDRAVAKLCCPRLSPQLADCFTESAAGLRLRRKIAEFEERLENVPNTLELVDDLEREFVSFARDYCPNFRCQKEEILHGKDIDCDLRTFRSRLILAERVLTDSDFD